MAPAPKCARDYQQTPCRNSEAARALPCGTPPKRAWDYQRNPCRNSKATKPPSCPKPARDYQPTPETSWSTSATPKQSRFNKCYVITAGISNATLTLQPSSSKASGNTAPNAVNVGTLPNATGGLPPSGNVSPNATVIALSSSGFAYVDGRVAAVTVNGQSFPVATSGSTGPNSWGILQAVGTGGIGYALNMVPTMTTIFFSDPSGAQSLSVGSGNSNGNTGTVTIVNGGVWSGVSDDSHVQVAFTSSGISYLSWPHLVSKVTPPLGLDQTTAS